jgi:MerR family transcriptional regulator, mercuric resistance operon regulatory protein
MPPSPSLSIGDLSRRTGCNIETIRYYERIGLLPKARRKSSGYRLFDEADVGRLSFVRRARELGFALNEVRALLGLAAGRNHTCSKVRDLAAAHLNGVHAKISDLRRLERVLKDMVAQCVDGTLPDCPVIETLAAGPGRATGRKLQRPAGAS